LYSGVINRYRDLMPAELGNSPVTLCEGNTPLIPLPTLSRMIGPDIRLYAKYEGLNPTGSFKDRGMTTAVTHARATGARAMMCASTGNTSAAAAAYAARAGMRCYVLIPDTRVAMGKLSQAIIHGAKVISIAGNFDRALALVREICEKEIRPIALVNSVNPYRLQGQKTGAFEIVDALGFAPDFHALPVGNAGNITAYWMGYKEYRELGRSSSLPRMLGFQAEGAAPIVNGAPVANPDTVATAIRIGNPASWKGALNAASESNGAISAVSDDEILSAYHALADKEGIFAEPASCTSIAGLLKLGREGFFTKPAVITAVLTGHGLKDPEAAVNYSSIKAEHADAEIESVLRLIDAD
jgi:threonine synthase